MCCEGKPYSSKDQICCGNIVTSLTDRYIQRLLQKSLSMVLKNVRFVFETLWTFFCKLVDASPREEGAFCVLQDAFGDRG